MEKRKELVKLEDVWVYYDGAPALEGVNLTVEQGAFLAVIGPNGGGKSTLLKTILGLVKPSHGRVTVFGEPPERGRRYIGYIPQHNLFDRDFPISVWDVVLMGRHGRVGLLHRYDAGDITAAEAALRTVDMLEQRERQIGKLSGGQQQRVFIARALVAEPRLLLLDEPTASIDPMLQAEFYELLQKLKQRMSIILVSHDVSVVSIYVDDIACLNRQLYYHGTKEIDSRTLEATYKCPIQLITHGDVPHRVLKEH